VTPADELARLAATEAGLDAALEEMLQDPDAPPGRHRRPLSKAALPNAPSQTISLASGGSLLLQALDPGVGRYLGLMTRLDDDPDARVAWITVGVFALDPGRQAPSGRRLGDILGPSDALEARLLVRLVQLFPTLRRVMDDQRRRGHTIRVLAAVAAAPPLPDRPAPPTVEPGRGVWLRDASIPNQTIRQELRLPDLPLSGLCALARQETGGGWLSLHRPLDTGAAAPRRAAMLAGRDQVGWGLLVDAPAPAPAVAGRYRVRVGDLFGRFGDATEVDAPCPARPRPPRPSLQTELHLPLPDPNDTGVRSPGALVVRVPVPVADQLGAGALPIAALDVRLGGVALATGPIVPGLAEATFDFPAVVPMGSTGGALVATFRDSAGTASPEARETVLAKDRRPPRPMRSGKGMIWTSGPGPAEEVELRLQWSAQGAQRYRAYIADAESLGVSTAGRTRAEIAEAASHLGPVEMRERFRLLTDPPLEAAGADVVLQERLPRALQTVQLIRVVPVSADNVEADFATCGLTPVAVPSDRRPPAPSLRVEVDPLTGTARIEIEATGLNLDALRSAEAGLFLTPRDPGARAPEYRLRRANASASDPVYARTLRVEALAPIRSGGDVIGFARVINDAAAGQLEPYVRYSFWAEVRMPPERRLPLGVPDIPSPIRAGALAQAEDMPGVFSAASAPAYALWAPPAAGLAAAQVTTLVTVDGGDASKVVVQATVAGVSAAHRLAVAPFTVEFVLRPVVGDAQRHSASPDHDGDVAWESPSIALADGEKASLMVRLLDPLRRATPPLMIEVERP
jgi:hypothetical protein